MKKSNVFLKIKSDIGRKYKEKCTPILKACDGKRLKVRKEVFLYYFVCTVSSIIGATLLICPFFGLLGLNLSPKILILAQIFVAAAILSYRHARKLAKSFENEIKSKVMSHICSCFGDLTWYHPSKAQDNYDFNKFNKTCLFAHYNEFEVDDFFEGWFAGFWIRISEASFYDVDFELDAWHRKRKRRQRKVFRGVIIEFDMNKRFKGHTVIKPYGLLHISPSFDLKHSELEDVEFEKKFDVFTNDEVEARYLITPAFMERIKNIQTAFDVDKTSIAFYKNKMYLSLETKHDLFSIANLNKPLYDPEQFIKLTEQIISVLKLIRHFKLQEKINSKRSV